MFLLRLLSACIFAGTMFALAHAHAQEPPRRGPPPDIARLLNLDAPRAAKVDAIMTAQREKMRAIHEDTEKQLAAVLTAQELAKLREARPPRPAH